MYFFYAEGEELRDAVLVTDGDSEMGQVHFTALFIFVINPLCCN